MPYWKCTDKHPFYSHISPLEVKLLFEQHGWDYDDYFKFTFVRNPWARQVSLYNMIYQTRAPRGLYRKIKTALNLNPHPSFKQWLSQSKADGRGAGGPSDQRWQVYGAYSIANYILDKNGNELVDDVIKLEEIDTKLPKLLARIGIVDADNLVIPHINRRGSKKYIDYYDAQSKALIADRYSYDIARFNYRFKG